MNENNPSTTPVKSSWRSRFTPARKPSLAVASGIRRGGLAVLALAVAATAGFGGGLLAGRNGANINTSSLTSQRKIVSSQGQLISQISKDVGPSVVSIKTNTTTQSTDYFGYGRTQDQQAAGTGMIISRDGYILTNRHVVPSGTTRVSVTLQDGTEFDDVEVVGRTSSSDNLDVAILKIKDLKGSSLTPVKFGNSSDASVGDSVVAIGNALGQFENTVTSGIISGFGRSVTASDGSGLYSSANSEDLVNLIQTDAAINQGNSGGPLVNLNGQVIGMNTAIASDAQNIGFAIPIDDVRGLINRVLASGKFERPYLGVRYVMLSADVAKEYKIDQTSGAYVVPSSLSGADSVLSGSPADKAGLKGGDVITKIGDTDLDASHNLATALNRYQPGDSVELTIIRDGKTIHVSAKLEAAPSS
jgi:serine protease Do